MYITRDYCKTDPWHAIIDMINNEYYLELQYDAVEIERFQPITHSYTRLVLKNKDGTPLPKSEFFYDRLDLNEFFRGGIEIEIDDVSLPYSTLDLIKKISQINDIVFTVDDLECQVYDLYDWTYSVKANYNSLRFVGSMNIVLRNTLKINLASVTNVHEFPEVVKLPALAGKGAGAYITPQFDFTYYRDSLIPVTTNSNWPSALELSVILKKVTKLPFTAKPSEYDYNIVSSIVDGEMRYKVLYNGFVIPEWSHRTDITNVLVIGLSDTLCKNYSGYLLLHYN